METPAEIRKHLAEILSKVADVPTASVKDTAVLADLGVNEKKVTKLTDGIEKAFNVRPSDESVAEWRTIGDVVRTVKRYLTYGSDPAFGNVVPMTPADAESERVGAFKQLATVFAVIGIAFGVLVGISFAALLATTGIGARPLPERPVHDTPHPMVTETNESPTLPVKPSPSASTASLTATPTSVVGAQQITLAGRLPKATPGEKLQVEVRDVNADWETFPVTVPAGADGSFTTYVKLGAPGKHEFRVWATTSDSRTPTVTVTIS